MPSPPLPPDGPSSDRPSPERTETLSRRKRLGFALVTVALGFLVPLLLAEGVLRFLPVSNWPSRMPLSPADPMARYRPDTRFVHSLGWNFSSVNRGRVNNAGFVNARDYDSTAATPLLAVVGDSYVEALMVPYDSTVAGRLQRRVGAAGRVYSFAISGAPLSQYLYYAQEASRRYRPSALAVVVVGNDFDQSLVGAGCGAGYHCFRPGADGALELAWLPGAQASRGGRARVNRLLKGSALVRYVFGNLLRNGQALGGDPTVVYVGNTPANLDSARVAGSRRAVDAFVDELPRRTGLSPRQITVVLDGPRPQLYDPVDRAWADSTFYGEMRRHLSARARGAGMEVIDLEPRMVARHQATGERFEFPNDSHWSASGHRVAAEALAGSAAFRAAFAAPPSTQAGLLVPRASLPTESDGAPPALTPDAALGRGQR